MAIMSLFNTTLQLDITGVSIERLGKRFLALTKDILGLSVELVCTFNMDSSIGPRVYLTGSLVIALVRPFVRWSVRL